MCLIDACAAGSEVQGPVDEQGWGELMAIHERALRESLAARDRSAERLRRSGQKGIEGRSVQVLFEAPKR
jgi:hypothetical protein